MSNPNTFTLPSRWRPWLVAAALLGYGAFIAYYYSPVAAGADWSGYLGDARWLTQGKLTDTLRVVPEMGSQPWFHFMPIGFVGEFDAPVVKTMYPIGLPLHLAAAALVLGWTWGPIAVGVFTALAAVVLCYRCARELDVGPLLAGAGAVALGASPLFLYSAVQVLSDALATTWCLAAVYAALRARRTTGWSIACGAAFAMAVLVRPSNLVLLPALVVILWRWRNLLGTFVGGLPGAVGLAIYQHIVYGHATRSGYGNPWGVFGAEYFAPTMAHYGVWIPKLMPLATLLLLPVALLSVSASLVILRKFHTALALPLVVFLPWRKRWRELSGLLLWIAGFVLFYAFYVVTSESWASVRFILPCFPALALIALVGLEALARKALEARRALFATGIACAVAAVSLFGSYWAGRKLYPLRVKQNDAQYFEVANWTRTGLPANAVVVSLYASGSIYFYTDFPLLRWDTVTAAEFGKYSTALAQAGRPLFAVLFPEEDKLAFESGRIPGKWEKFADVGRIGVWRFAGPE